MLTLRPKTCTEWIGSFCFWKKERDSINIYFRLCPSNTDHKDGTKFTFCILTTEQHVVKSVEKDRKEVTRGARGTRFRKTDTIAVIV